MSIRKSRLVTLMFGTFLAGSAAAQTASTCTPVDGSRSNDNTSWNLTAGGYGISVGDAAPLRGVRFGFHDTGAYSVDGLNLTLWGDGDCAQSRVRGLSLSLVGPNAGEIRGIALGGVVRANNSTGLSVGIATEAGGWQRGITVAGVFAHARQGIAGISASGIALVSEGSLIGVSIAPIAVMTNYARGITLAAGVVSADSSLTGVSLGGVALLADGDSRWITASTLGTVVGGNTHGLAVSGLWLSSGASMTGFNASGLVIRAGGPARWVTVTPGVLTVHGAVEGLGIGGLHLGAESGHGVLISATNHVSGLQSGISIGLINDVGDLHGVQIGLLNRVRGWHGAGRLLPLIQFGR